MENIAISFSSAYETVTDERNVFFWCNLTENATNILLTNACLGALVKSCYFMQKKYEF